MSGFICSMVGASFTVAAVAEVIRAKVSVSAFGEAQVDTAQSQFGGSSAVFDGVGDYLRAGTTGFLYSPGNDVTMELWFRIETTLSGEFNGLISLGSARGASSNEWTMFVMQNSATGFNRRLQMGHNFSILIGSTTNLNINQWYHVAATRSGTTFTLWLDGVSQGTATSTLTLGQGTGAKIGSHNDGTLVHRGWIDEVRISNTARYTTAFTPATSAFVSDSNTQLLLHMDGTDRSPFFVDDNRNTSGRDPKLILANGNAQISTAQSQFGGSSYLGDGTGDYLRINDTGNLAYGTADFTIEFWIRFSSTATQIIWDQRPPGVSTTTPTIYLSGSVLKYFANNGDRITGSTLTTGIWYHIAVSRSGTSTRMFINGTQTGSTYTDSTNYTTGTPVVLGADSDALGNSSVNGHIDEVRVSNTARYTANFTAPTEPFVNDANTLLLLHMNGINASTNFVDDNGNRNAKGILAIGNAQISTAQSQFGGSSALLDGTGDYLTTTNTSVGSGEFTVEFFIRFTTLPAARNGSSWQMAWTGATAEDYMLMWSDSIQLAVGNTFGSFFFGSTMSTNTWYHIALVRSAGDYKVFFNGTDCGAATNDGSGGQAWTNRSGTRDWTGNGTQFIGTYSGNTSKGIIGHIDEVRVSNTARYTANFTAPTEPFVNDANTLLLIHANGSNASIDFVDDAPGVLSSVTQMLPVDAVTSTASTITIPTWALADDYAVLFDYSTTTTLTVPSGWTQITTSTTTGIRSTVSYKKLASGDINTSITGMGGTTRKVLVIVRGNAPVSSVTLSTPTQQATTATPTNQTISMSGSVAPVMGFAHYTSTGAITTRTGTGNLKEFTSATNQYVKVWAYRPSESTNITVGQSDNGTNALQSFWIRFNP